MQLNSSKFFLITGILFFIIYSFSATTVPTGIADADELTLTSFFLSVPHPPGFPLFTLIGHAGISFLRQFFSVAHAANIISAFYQSVAIAFLFLINHQLFTLLATRHRLLHPQALALLTTSLMGFSYFLWQYATIYEITSFTAMLACITLYFALNWFINPNHASRQYYLTWFFFGLLLSHFHLTVLYLPAFFILLITKRSFNFKAFAAGCLLLMLTFILSSSLLLILNQDTPFTWNFPQTPTGLWHHLTRQDYVGLDVESNTHYRTAFSLPNIFNLTTIKSIVLFFSLLITHHNPFILIIALFGAYFLFRSQRSLFWFIFALFFFSGPFLAAYMHIATYNFEVNLLLGIAERQFVLAEVAFGLFLIPGIIFLLILFSTHKSLLLVILNFLLGYQIIYNSSILLHRQDRELNHRYLKQNLEAAPPHSLIICSTDIDCYGLWAQHFLENVRPDITILSHAPVYQRQFLTSNINIYPFSQYQNPHYFQFLLTHNLHQRPIYFTSGIGFYDKYLGLEDGPFFLIPTNNLFALQSQYPHSLYFTALPDFIFTTSQSLDKRSLYARGIIEAIANNQAYAGYLSLKYQNVDIANQYLASAYNLDPHNSQTQELINQQSQIIYSISLKDPQLDPQTLVAYGQQAAKTNQLDDASQAFRYALLLGGNNPTILQSALNFYQSLGDTTTATYIRELLLYNNSAPE